MPSKEQVSKVLSPVRHFVEHLGSRRTDIRLNLNSHTQVKSENATAWPKWAFFAYSTSQIQTQMPDESFAKESMVLPNN